MSDTPPAAQPVGILGFPDGLLLVPDGEDFAATRTQLLAGRVPDGFPECLTATSATDPITRFNRWVLEPEGDEPDQIRAGLPAALAPMVDLVLFSMLRGPLPEPAESTAPEVAALLLAGSASRILEGADHDSEAESQAQDLLVRAAGLAQTRSPVLAATLLANSAEVGDPTYAAATITSALGTLDDTDLVQVRAELRLRLGSLAQERAAGNTGQGSAGQGSADGEAQLRAAMTHYYDALQLVSEESAPYLWASLNLNLATAQLSVPMTTASDQLRLGVATMALRAARRVFEQTGHHGPWSTATLNLANALVYTPSTHQGDNLVEAVELYEEVLASGVRDADPLGRARLLANLGNVLAHLGLFDDAIAKLSEARSLFEEQLDHASVLTVREVLAEIARTRVTDPDEELSDLARQAEQMSRMPVSDGAFTSGMGVEARPVTQVSVVDASSRPTGAPAGSPVDGSAS